MSDLTVNDVVPPRCRTCDRPLTTRSELNRSIDQAIDFCDACEAEWEYEAEACDCSYGFFLGGDPRRFKPDDEMNSPEELARWRAACAAWDRGDHAPPTPEEHGPWVDQVTRAVTLGERPLGPVVGMCSAYRSFGMGTTYCHIHRPGVRP